MRWLMVVIAALGLLLLAGMAAGASGECDMLEAYTDKTGEAQLNARQALLDIMMVSVFTEIPGLENTGEGPFEGSLLDVPEWNKAVQNSADTITNSVYAIRKAPAPAIAGKIHAINLEIAENWENIARLARQFALTADTTFLVQITFLDQRIGELERLAVDELVQVNSTKCVDE